MLVSHHHFDNETMMKPADKGYSLSSLWISDTTGLPTALNQQAQGAQSTMPPSICSQNHGFNRLPQTMFQKHAKTREQTDSSVHLISQCGFIFVIISLHANNRIDHNSLCVDVNTVSPIKKCNLLNGSGFH